MVFLAPHNKASSILDSEMKQFILSITAACLVCFYSEICGFARVCVSFARVYATADKVYSHSDSQSILCVGASHMGSSIAERPIIKNIWLHSSSAKSCLVRVAELERRGRLHGFKYCILETSPFDYGASCSVESQSRYADLLFRELPINWRYIRKMSLNGSMLMESLGREILASRTSFTTTFELDSSTNSHALLKDRASMVTRPEAWKEERLSFYLKLHYDDYLQRNDVTSNRMRIYNDIKNICEKYGIKVVVFSAPLSQAYRNHIPGEALKRHRRFLNELTNAGFVVFDRYDGYGDEYFFDPTHLANNGAEKFTEELLAFLHM